MQSEVEEKIKLTAYSKGAGCGCKIAPAVLQQILGTNHAAETNTSLIIGNGRNEDAAVYNLHNGKYLISTTDFFAPVVDDAFAFGKIAAANAISDVYAMGGKPLFALAILGWPVDKLSPQLAAQVLDGARETCKNAGITLAGGHSIESAEPFFGLAVNGEIDAAHLKTNDGAQAGDEIYITKPIGLGILSTAQKRGLLTAAHEEIMFKQMSALNNIGEALGKIDAVHAMTDVTGFGLLGHLIEMAEGAQLSVALHYEQIPVVPGAREYLKQRIVPDATYRNWNAYQKQVSFAKDVDVMEAFSLLPDPQTNGGLLISVAPEAKAQLQTLFQEYGLQDMLQPIGSFVSKKEVAVQVL